MICWERNNSPLLLCTKVFVGLDYSLVSKALMACGVFYEFTIKVVDILFDCWNFY